MKKKRWRLLAAVLALAMVMGMAAGCSGKGESEKKTADSGKKGDDPKAFTIGFPWQTSSTDPTFVSIENNVRAAVEAAGGEIVVVESDLSADDLINNVSDLISRGVDGIIMMPASDSMLATATQACISEQCSGRSMMRRLRKRSMILNIMQADAMRKMKKRHIIL